MQTKKPAGVYTELQDSVCLANAQRFGEWTIPYITANIAGNLDGKQRQVKRNAASIGALLVNTLASKLTGVLFPVSRPFFRARYSEKLMKRVLQSGDFTEDQAVDRLAELAKASHALLFRNRGYAAVTQLVRHLVVTGNACLYRDRDKSRSRVYGLANFTVQRDTDGEVIQAVIRDHTVYEALPPDIQQRLQSQRGDDPIARKGSKVTRYWWVQREHRSKPGYSVREFVDDIEIKDKDWYPDRQCPWVFPVWNLIPGESYGHGHVEDYSSDFLLLSQLTIGSLEYAMEMMRVLYLVGPAAGTQVHDLQNAINGAYVRGDPQNIIPMELGNGGQKLAQVDAKIEAVIIRLSKAFMYSGATRDAERVTAYELQRDAQEAETLLGGVYSTLTGELQAPLAYLLMIEVDKAFEVPILDSDLWPEVQEGIPSLGQSNDIENLLAFSQQMAAVMPVVQLHKEIDPARVANLLREANNITAKQIYFTPEELRQREEAQEAQQAADQSLLQAASVADQSDTIQQALGG